MLGNFDILDIWLFQTEMYGQIKKPYIKFMVNNSDKSRTGYVRYFLAIRYWSMRMFTIPFRIKNLALICEVWLLFQCWYHTHRPSRVLQCMSIKIACDAESGYFAIPMVQSPVPPYLSQRILHS